MTVIGNVMCHIHALVMCANLPICIRLFTFHVCALMEHATHVHIKGFEYALFVVEIKVVRPSNAGDEIGRASCRERV